jgi:uncharacterized protein (TIRG00374 family)
MSLRRWLVTIASFAAAVAVSLYLVISTWPGHGATAIVPLQAHLLALLAVTVDLVSRAWKVRLSAASLGVRVSFGAALRTGLGGDFGAAITPARSGAEPARFLILSEAGVPVAGTLLVLFAELFLEMLSLVVVALGLAIAFRDSGTSMVGIVGLIGGYAIFVTGVGVFGMILASRSASGPPPGWAQAIGFNAGRWRAIQRALRQLRTSAAAVREAHWGLGALALGASVIHVLARLTVLPALVYSFGVAAPLSQLLLWPLALFYGGVVAPLPGGGGFIEVVFKAALSNDIPPAVFGAALIWWRFYSFYLYVILGAIAAGRTVMRALRDGEKEVSRAA